MLYVIFLLLGEIRIAFLGYYQYMRKNYRICHWEFNTRLLIKLLGINCINILGFLNLYYLNTYRKISDIFSVNICRKTPYIIQHSLFNKCFLK